MKAVECERENCKGYITWDVDHEAYECDVCETLYE